MWLKSRLVWLLILLSHVSRCPSSGEITGYYLWDGIVYLHVAAVDRIWIELLGRSGILWGNGALICTLTNTIEWLRRHRRILRRWGPRRHLWLRKERCVLRTNIKAFRIISTLFCGFSSFTLSRSVLRRDRARSRHLIAIFGFWILLKKNSMLEKFSGLTYQEWHLQVFHPCQIYAHALYYKQPLSLL
jgi:hypothetical protein